jgi:hypothetical protein
MTRRKLLTLATMALLGLTVATVSPQLGFAQSNPWIGTWKLNLAKSTYSPGPPPKSQTATFEAVGQGVMRLTLEAINAQGNPTKQVQMDFDDGQPHPVMGVPAYDAQSDKVINDHTTWVIRTKAGKMVQTLISVVSADGKTWTVTTAGVDTNGQQINNVIVRDKQ